MMLHRVGILSSLWHLRVITNYVIDEHVRDWVLQIAYY